MDSGDSSSGEEAGISAPVLPEALRVKIPRASLRYLLIHHLKLNYRYTKKKMTFSDPKKRHQRIRKYIIEMDRALKMQDASWDADNNMTVNGDYVLVFRTFKLQLSSWAGATTPRMTTRANRTNQSQGIN